MYDVNVLKARAIPPAVPWWQMTATRSYEVTLSLQSITHKLTP